MKSLWVWLLSLAAVASFVSCNGCSILPAHSPRLTQAQTLQHETIALYHVDEAGDAIAYCAGVWIDKKHILTAAHCVEIQAPQIPGLEIKIDPIGSEINYAIVSDFQSEPIVKQSKFVAKTARVIAVNTDTDLALLEALGNIPKHPEVWLSRTPINTGDLVMTVGHTVGFSWSYLSGYVGMVRLTHTSEKLLSPKVQVIQVSLPLWFGNSGGGVFNEDGHLIGIASFIIQRGPNIAFAIHRDVILDFLVKNRLANP